MHHSVTNRLQMLLLNFSRNPDNLNFLYLFMRVFKYLFMVSTGYKLLHGIVNVCISFQNCFRNMEFSS